MCGSRVPFAREYGGLLANRSFGGAQVSRTFYARGQTGQQLLLGAYSALSRQVANGKVKLFPRTEMMDLVVIDGQAKGIVTRNLITGAVETHAAHAVLLCTGGYGNVFFFLPMRWGLMLPQHGEHTSVEHFLPILVLHRFTLLAFQYLETTSPS